MQIIQQLLIWPCYFNIQYLANYLSADCVLDSGATVSSETIDISHVAHNKWSTSKYQVYSLPQWFKNC